MATIKAEWRRTVSIKPYETEALGLSVEQGVVLPSDLDVEGEATALVAATQELTRMLAKAGDALTVERLEARYKEQQGAAAVVRRPSQLRPEEPQAANSVEEPDEYLRK